MRYGKNIMRLCALLSTSSLVYGCAGGGAGVTSGAGAIANPIPVASIAPGRTIARVKITIPPKSTATSAAKPAYVSPATQSIAISVDGAAPTTQNLTSGSPNCAVPAPLSPLTCTVDIPASGGTHTFTFTTYDQTGAAGSVLSVNGVTQSLTLGQVNLVNVTLAGVPKSIFVLPAPNARVSGDQNGLTYIFGRTQSVVATALDADGNVIVGPGAPTMSASVTGTPAAHFGVTANVSGNPNAIGITATTAGSATLTLTATPTSALAGSPLSVSVPVTSTVLVSTLDGNGPGVADGPASVAKLGGNGWVSGGISYDPADGNLYFGDSDCSVRQVVPSGANAGTITTIAGLPAGYVGCPAAPADGVGTSTSGTPGLSAFYGTAYNANDGNIYFSDYMFGEVRRVSTGGVVMTMAGQFGNTSCTYQDGTGGNACFASPEGMAYDANDKNLYVFDTQNCAVRRIDVSANTTNGGVVTTVAGSMPPVVACGLQDGTAGAARLNQGWGLTYDSGDGFLYAADTSNCAIRQIDPVTGAVKTIAGGTCGEVDGTGSAAEFNEPYGITYDSTDGNLYVVDMIAGAPPNYPALRQVTTSGVVTTLVRSIGATVNGYGTTAQFVSPASLTYDPTNDMLFIYDSIHIRQVEL